MSLIISPVSALPMINLNSYRICHVNLLYNKASVIVMKGKSTALNQGQRYEISVLGDLIPSVVGCFVIYFLRCFACKKLPVIQLIQFELLLSLHLTLLYMCQFNVQNAELCFLSQSFPYCDWISFPQSIIILFHL